MLKKLTRLFAQAPKSDHPEATQAAPKIIAREEHGISRKHISKNALDVIYELRRAGYDAYLVGGGVRDLLLGGKPKDFDVATNATPEQVKQLFRRARIVGRRFRIAHVRFGREIIEVTTFRAGHEQQHNNSGHAVSNDRGMLLRDNVYGSLWEDALRRDFSVNALYYSVDGFTVLDHVGGMQDLQSKTLRIIGEATQRYDEDPVRMLRAVRFASKLGFELESDTAAAIAPCAPQLSQVSSSRLFDETLKLFLSGNGQGTYLLLREHQLFKQIYPSTAEVLRNGIEECYEGAFFDRLIKAALASTDQRVAKDKPVTPAFIYAALLWPVVQDCLYKTDLAPGDSNHSGRMHAASQRAIEIQLQTTSIPKRFSIAMREIWSLQHRLIKGNRKRAATLCQHPRFRAAYDFLLLREQAGEDLNGSGDWWTQYQLDHPQDDIKRAPRRARKPRRRRSGRKTAATSDEATTKESQPHS